MLGGYGFPITESKLSIWFGAPSISRELLPKRPAIVSLPDERHIEACTQVYVEGPGKRINKLLVRKKEPPVQSAIQCEYKLSHKFPKED